MDPSKGLEVKLAGTNDWRKSPDTFYLKALTVPEPAIYHHDYVQEIGFEQLDPAQYSKTSAVLAVYQSNPVAAHKRNAEDSGRAKYDFTAYPPEQKDWGKDRLNRPAVLFELFKPVRENMKVPTSTTSTKGVLVVAS
jgi:hypothetical protein